MADVKTACRDINELSSKAQIACNMFMTLCKEAGLNIGISETYRSQERQDYLYSLGRTRIGKKVTWTKNSRHTSRRAWDIYHNKKGDEYNSAILAKAGEIGKSLGIIWGGDWSTPDYPHFEIAENWKIPVDKIPMPTAVEAIWQLNLRGIINTPDIWYDGTWTMDNVRDLLRKFGGSADVGTAIWNLHLNGVISEYQKWYDGKWSKDDVYWLIRKYYRYLQVK